MNNLPLRRSQAIVPFGVGAMVDFPQQSLMAGGLDAWPDLPEMELRDDRLARRLLVDGFREPPRAPEKGHDGGGYLPFVRFPLWHSCPRCDGLHEAQWNDPGSPLCRNPRSPSPKMSACSSLPDRGPRSKCRMIPLRFVVACSAGHITDFPWLLWAHRKSGEELDSVQVCSQSSLRLRHSGRAGLEGIIVECVGCGAKKSMMGCAGPNGLFGFKCRGERPWLGPEGREATCSSMSPPVVVQRGGSNVYFAKVASSILIPPLTSPVRRIIDEPTIWDLLTCGVAIGGMPDDQRIKMVAKNKRLDFDTLRAAVQYKLSGAGLGNASQSESEYRHAEYVALNGPKGGEGDFVIRPLDGSAFQRPVGQYVERVVLVEKLAETRALTGFSRVSPPVRGVYDQQDILQLSLTRKAWLPAVRVFGEGIFINMKRDVMDTWSLLPAVIARSAQLAKTAARIAAERSQPPRRLTPHFFLLHTLSHLLIRRLAFECGYGSSSLRERIYCDEGTGNRMCGILIYTAAGDCEGTMGGLTQQGLPERFEKMVELAVRAAHWCSSDPLCIESNGQGTDSLNLGACHACSLLPETCCEEGNRLLDRAFIVGTTKNPELGYFQSIIRESFDM